MAAQHNDRAASHAQRRHGEWRRRATHGGLWRVAWTVAWRGMHTYIRRPDLIFPSLIFPLVFFASFAGGLSALGKVPGFTFPAGYTAFQFVFVMCQSAMFSGLFTGFTLAFDFESGFARRLMLAAEDRRGIALGYAIVALSRAAITLSLVTVVALISGMKITGDGVDIVGLYGLAALLVLVGYGWAGGVAFRFRTIQAGPLMQTPVFLILFLAPVYVPLELLKGWIHDVASVNPATAFLDAGRGLISGVQNHTGLAYRVRGGPDPAVRDLAAHRSARGRTGHITWKAWKAGDRRPCCARAMRARERRCACVPLLVGLPGSSGLRLERPRQRRSHRPRPNPPTSPHRSPTSSSSSNRALAWPSPTAVPRATSSRKSESVGPDFAGFAGHAVTLADGRRVLVDEHFLREGLLHPEQAELKGYDPAPMLAAVRRLHLSGDPGQVAALAAFIEQIGPEQG